MHVQSYARTHSLRHPQRNCRPHPANMTELEPRRPDDGEDRLQGTSCRKVPFCKKEGENSFAQENVFFWGLQTRIWAEPSSMQLELPPASLWRRSPNNWWHFKWKTSGHLTLEMHYNRVKFLRYELLVKGGQLGWRMAILTRLTRDAFKLARDQIALICLAFHNSGWPFP